ncbi:Chemotaxis protein CheY [compost metagenome]|uniref:HD-like signal output (HDOD) domain, no enzymatic activity n=1 Tax=Pseudomonas jinjuensis TaxID=198616 RepID=A0A1H0BLR8_9PSED|nr:HDOD domain-containing protein [Pseudomonas jinjuensis]SDN46552.1 HD-like signal output (HDOD) domain, no enzymatic activity [Pseudomonas jinjuensis]
MTELSPATGVLVAAADSWNRELLGQLVLSVRCDADIQFCADGAQAIEALRRRAFALVLVEQELPQADGLEVLRAVRQLRRGGDAPAFILISSRADAASVRAVLPMAPTAYLVKPYNAEDLRQRLQKLLLTPGQAVVCAVPELKPGLDLPGFLRLARASAEGAPLMAGVESAVSRCLNAGECAIGDLENEFGRDPQLTACLIAAANSAARHVGMPCQTLAQALARLGIAQALNLALGVSLQRAALLADPQLQARGKEFWELSQRCADSAETLALELGAGAPRCYTAGLLHCLGELAVLRCLQDWRDRGGELEESAIEQSLHEHAAGFGSALRARWRLPLELRELIAGAYGVGSGVYSRETLILNLAASAVRLPEERRGELAESKAARMLGLKGAKAKVLQGL